MPVTDWLQLQDRPCLVVGAGGLGGASAASLATLGARVLLVDINQRNLDAVRLRAKEAGADIELRFRPVLTYGGRGETKPLPRHTRPMTHQVLLD